MLLLLSFIVVVIFGSVSTRPTTVIIVAKIFLIDTTTHQEVILRAESQEENVDGIFRETVLMTADNGEQNYICSQWHPLSTTY